MTSQLKCFQAVTKFQSTRKPISYVNMYGIQQALTGKIFLNSAQIDYMLKNVCRSGKIRV